MPYQLIHEITARIIFGLIGLLFLSLSIFYDSPPALLTGLYGLCFLLRALRLKFSLSIASILAMSLGLYTVTQLIISPQSNSILMDCLFILISGILVFRKTLVQYSFALIILILCLCLSVKLGVILNLYFGVIGLLLTIYCSLNMYLNYKNKINLKKNTITKIDLAIFHFDWETQKLFINSAFAKLFQLEPYLPTIPLNRLRDVIDETQYYQLERSLNKSYFGQKKFSLTLKLKHNNHHYIQMRANYTHAKLHGFAFDCSKAEKSDMSLKKQNQHLKELAYYDELTGLPNRWAFEMTAKQILAAAKRHQFKLAWLYIDLDWFKTVNDVHGHHVGDLVLQACAQRLRTCLRAEDALARMGGDEFFALLSHFHHTQEVIDMSNKLINTLRQPIAIHGLDISLGASIGIALYPDHGSQVEELMTRADLALAQAKKMGKGRVICAPNE